MKLCASSSFTEDCACSSFTEDCASSCSSFTEDCASSSSSSMELCPSSMELCPSSMELCPSSMELCASASSSNCNNDIFFQNLGDLFVEKCLMILLLEFYGIVIINKNIIITKIGNVFFEDFINLFVEKALTNIMFEYYGGNYLKIQPYMFVMTIYIGDTKYCITDKQYIGDNIIITNPNFNVEIYYM